MTESYSDLQQAQADAEAVRQYYADLLILQYHSKPNC